MITKASLLLSLATILLALSLQVNSQDCTRQRTCEDCIGTAGCVWCRDTAFNGTRCTSNITTTDCPLDMIENPGGSVGPETVVNSPDCSGNGNFTCGVCECNDQYCGPTVASWIFLGAITARRVNGELCSGRGTCECGCQCSEPRYSGDACQCDSENDVCRITPGEGQVCSGRGMCCDGECMCGNSSLNNPYHGDLCECEPREEVCFYAPSNSECNSQGICRCGGCTCISEWEGDFCQIPVTTQCNFDLDLECIRQCLDPMVGAPEVCMATQCSPHRPTLFVNMAEIEESTRDADLERFVNRALGISPPVNIPLVRECNRQITNCFYTYYVLSNDTNRVVVVERGETFCRSISKAGLAIPTYAVTFITLGVLILLGA